MLPEMVSDAFRAKAKMGACHRPSPPPPPPPLAALSPADLSSCSRKIPKTWPLSLLPSASDRARSCSAGDAMFTYLYETSSDGAKADSHACQRLGQLAVINSSPRGHCDNRSAKIPVMPPTKATTGRSYMWRSRTALCTAEGSGGGDGAENVGFPNNMVPICLQPGLLTSVVS